MSMLTADEARSPMTVIAQGLAAQARGESVDEEKMMDAATYAVAAQLVRSGMSMGAVERQFTEREHSFRFAYEADDDGEPCLKVEVIWEDEEDTP